MTHHCGATSVAASVAAQASTASHCAPCDAHTATLLGAANRLFSLLDQATSGGVYCLDPQELFRRHTAEQHD